MMIVTLYTKIPDATGPCPYCERARQWLVDNGIPFTEVPLSKDARQDCYDQWGLKDEQRMVPQVFIREADGEPDNRIGGYDQLIKSRLETLFQEPPPPPELPEPRLETLVYGRLNNGTVRRINT